jgi:hypothetical protein
MKRQIEKAPATLTVHVPMTFAIRGGRKAIISEAAPPVPQPRIDNALLKALARAHRWRRMIENGVYSSITELAEAEKVNQSYACRLLRMTLLAPAVVKDILDGRESGILLKQISKPFPIRWSERLMRISFAFSQRMIFRFSEYNCPGGVACLTTALRRVRVIRPANRLGAAIRAPDPKRKPKNRMGRIRLALRFEIFLARYPAHFRAWD